MMKKRLVTLGLMALCLGGVSAQPPATLQEAPRTWAEKLFGATENLSHDFGAVPHGAILRHDFVITNIYAEPLAITDIRTSAGCVTPYVHKAELKPKEKTTLSIWVNTSRFHGKKEGAIFVEFGPKHVSVARLSFTATSRQDTVCDPGEVRFMSVRSGDTPSEVVDFKYSGPLLWKIGEVVVPKGMPVEIVVKETSRDKDKVSYQAKVTIKKDAAPGSFEDRILFKTNDTTMPMLPILVRGKVEAPK